MFDPAPSLLLAFGIAQYTNRRLVALSDFTGATLDVSQDVFYMCHFEDSTIFTDSAHSPFFVIESTVEGCRLEGVQIVDLTGADPLICEPSPDLVDSAAVEAAQAFCDLRISATLN